MKNHRSLGFTELKKHLPALIPAIIMLGIAPWFVKFTRVVYPEMPVTWRSGEMVSGDLFAYAKHMLIMLSGIMSALYLFFNINIPQLKNSKFKRGFIYIITAAVWLVFTTITAKSPYIAFWGGSEKFEGLIIWLTYFAFALYVAKIINSPEKRLYLLRVILFGGLVVTGIGLTQFLGHDIIRAEWYKMLVMPKEVADKANFLFEANRVYSTLYNPNFAAMYVATLFPLSLFMIYFDNNRVFKGLWGIFSVLLIVNLIGSKSAGGYVGLILALAILLFVLLIKKLPQIVRRIATLALVSLSVIGLSLFLTGSFNNMLHVPAFTVTQQPSNIEIDGFTATFTNYDSKLILRADSETLDRITFYDDQNVQQLYNINAEGVGTLIDPRFANISFSTRITENTQQKMAAIDLNINNIYWTFLISPQGLLYVNGYNKVVPINEPVAAMGGFVGHEQFGSARGYIWSRTLPLIVASPVVGYGADNFIVAFPQTEYLAKHQLYSTPHLIVDKAHSFPLQLVVSFGLMGALLLGLVIAFSTKHLFIEHMETGNWLPVALIMCLFGFIGSGLFYDSNLHVAPFFWTFVGFGFKDLFKA